MRTIEAEGATVEEAIAAALATLGVVRDQAEVEILEDGSRGFLGLASRKAKVRVTPKDRVAAGEQATSPTSRDVSRETVAPATADRSASAADLVREILRHISPDATVAVSPQDDEGTIRIVVQTEDSGIVIGRHGQTLDAIEHLVNRIVFRDEWPAGGRVALDVEGYRERRQEQLEDQARRLAEKVRDTGRSVAMAPMSARDRRTVHLTLRDEPGITTESEGERDFRHVVISPERSSGGNRPLRR